MDNLSLEALVRELGPRVLNTTIQKIKMAGERKIVLYLRSGVTECLVLSLHPWAPGLFISDQNRIAEGAASDALLTLRKYLVGGRITQIRKELPERVVFFDVETHRLSGRAQKISLVLELIPNRVRILLLNGERALLASFPQSHWAEAISHIYEPPVRKASYQIDTISREQFLLLFSAQPGRSGWRQISGLSPAFVSEVIWRSRADPKLAWEELQALLAVIREGPYSPRIYNFEDPSGKTSENVSGDLLLESSSEPIPRSRPLHKLVAPVLDNFRKLRKIVSPVSLSSFDGADVEVFPTVNDAYLAWCGQLTDQLSEGTELQSRLKRISADLKKRLRLKQNLEADFNRSLQAEAFKLYADLLYAQSDKSPRGLEILRVVNLFDPQLREIDIPLDSRASVIANANRYSKLYQKANRSVPLIRARIQNLHQEINTLQTEARELHEHKEEGISQSFAVAVSSDTKTQRLKAEAQSTRRTQWIVKHGEKDSSAFSNSQSLLRKVAKSFVSSEGLQILVGKSSKDNDVLTLKVARGEDFWLHVAGYGGSHVVLRNPQKLTAAPKQSLLEAAQLAAYFSQARNAPKVEVHYTQRRFVSKPKGAKPGLVHLKQYKSISARPQLLDESALP